MSTTTIADSRIRIKPSKKLLQVINAHKDDISEMPVNVANMLKKSGYSLPTKVETMQTNSIAQQALINMKLLSSIHKEPFDVNKPKDSESQPETKNKESNKDVVNEYLYLGDLHWVNQFLTRLRKEHDLKLYLHELLDASSVILPENEVIERNPALEARCEKLRLEQQNREYMKMTKNVDAVLKNYPEDTIAYQMKAINKQIIAVFQFVLSVVAGFVFGFYGLELIFGGLDFGLRLLMGIMFALIIALAEIYFLAKKLNEYDDITTATPNFLNKSSTQSKKVHAD